VHGVLTPSWRGGVRHGSCGDLGRGLVRVSVVIPTRNEREAIGRVLADLPSNLVTEVIVVDNNSTDGTAEIAARMGVRIISEPRRGYGQACLTGLACASAPDVVVFLDGDYSDRPAELPRLLAPLCEGRGDITLGSRLAETASARALPRTLRLPTASRPV
jgi:glycosyltransferase involved in cell wall biosynthesis